MSAFTIRTGPAATRGEGRKVEDVAPELGLDVKKAKGMALQASKKLNQAARGG